MSNKSGIAETWKVDDSEMELPGGRCEPTPVQKVLRTRTPTLTTLHEEGSGEADREVPLGPVEVAAGQTQGLELLESSEDNLVVIAGVRPGSPWGEWNEKHPKQLAQTGDQIVRVNDKRDHAEAWPELALRPAGSRTMTMWIRRPAENRVRVVKDEGDTLGLVLLPLESGHLFIDSIQAGGLVHQWNLENQDHQVRPLDEIVEINGTRGKQAELVQALAEPGMTELVLMTHPQ